MPGYETAINVIHHIRAERDALRKENDKFRDVLSEIASIGYVQAVDAPMFAKEWMEAARDVLRAAPTEDRCAECDCKNGGTECTWIKSGSVAAPTEGEA